MTKIWHKVVNEISPTVQSVFSRILQDQNRLSYSDLLDVHSGWVDDWDCQRLLFFPHFSTRSISYTEKKSKLSTLSLWTWRRPQWVSLFCVIVDRRYVFERLRAENTHVATETGMLKQDFSAINESLNNSWVTGGTEIKSFGYDGCGQCLVLNVPHSFNKFFSILSWWMVQLINSAVAGAAEWSNPRDWDVIDLAMSEAQAHRIKLRIPVSCRSLSIMQHVRLAVVVDNILRSLLAPY